MKKIYMWCGSGYLLDEIDVTDYLGDRTDISIEEVAYLCVKKNCGVPLYNSFFYFSPFITDQ